MRKKTISKEVIDNSPPIYYYIFLFIIFISIVYLIVLRQRVDEFFENNNTSYNNHIDTPTTTSPSTMDSINTLFIKQEVNPFEIEKVWQGKLSENDQYLSIWQRKNKKTQDLYSLGQYAMMSKNKLEALPDESVQDIPILNMLAKGGKFPLSYVKIWSSDMLTTQPDKDFSIWQPVPPEGYKALGDIVSPSLSSPPRNKIVCLPVSNLKPNNQFKKFVYKYKSEPNLSIWNIGNYKSFVGSQTTNEPSVRQSEIMEINQETLAKPEFDSTEIYKGLKITLSTSKLNPEKNNNTNNINT